MKLDQIHNSIFFKSYTHKLWGIDPDKLSSEFAKQRIKDFSLGEAILQLFKRSAKHKTLVDQFAYPLKGNGYVYEKMKLLFLKNGGIIEFNKDSKGYLLLQEIRDESHRFAINAQRKKKNKKNRQSQLDNVEGIGEVLKKRLLLNFKSLKNIKSANIEDLMTVKGINAKIAQLIKEKL